MGALSSDWGWGSLAHGPPARGVGPALPFLAERVYQTLTVGHDRIGSAGGRLGDRVGPRFGGIADGLCLGLRRRSDGVFDVRIIKVTFAEIVDHVVRQQQRHRHIAG